MITIAEASRQYGLSADTLRYYERIGLIPAVPRNKSGIRNYDEESLRWVEFIKCMRNAGLSIESLVEYVALFQQGEATHEARKNILIEERAKLEIRIQEMLETKKRLDYKISNYTTALSKKEEYIRTGNKE